MKRKYYFLIAIAVLLVYSALLEPNWIATKTYDVAIPGLRSQDLTVVHLADIHATEYGRREQHVAKMVNRLRPDFVFITGDLLKAHSRLPSGLTFLANLEARFGVYLVPGNADGVLLSALKWKKTPRDSLNYHILTNESVDCGAFTLVGLDDPVGERTDVEKAFEDVVRSKPVIVLSHFHPDSLLWDLEEQGIDLMLSGHTHGGQFGLAEVVGLVPYAYRSRYIAGLYHLNGFQLIVTRGVGTNIFPLRFLCRPEIVVLNLKGV
jgi:predicted MPP superfamily phosphohydrolase